MNYKSHNAALVLGVVFVACFLIALVVSHRSDSSQDASGARPGFTLTAAPLLSSNRIADSKSFHRRSFVQPFAASSEPVFRVPVAIAPESRAGDSARP